ncbi:SymE family type I addiction module toxin [Cupriavidus sp. IDO]|uniref:SymE family type I addiction module toxin n=1 Tax=Cupriavidus sp. IDO TaxID=1539142 RepID=UPI0009E500F8
MTEAFLPHVRTLTTGLTHFPVTPSDRNGFTGLRAVPWIRLKGIWLEKAGLTIGRIARIEVRPGQIVIFAE